MGQPNRSDAQVVEAFQDVQTSLHTVAVLNDQNCSKFARRFCLPNIFRCPCDDDFIGVGLDLCLKKADGI